MQCPHCKANVTRKERSGNVCSKCYQEFAFEPKQHPLGLNDLRFQRTVAKISENDKLYFTSSQLQFALSRKRLNSNTTIIFLVVLAIVTSIITLAFYSPAIVVVMSGLAQENCKASCAMSTPRFWQCSAAFRAAACTSFGSRNQTGNVALVSNLAANGPPFMIPMFFALSFGTNSSAKRVF